MFIDQRCPKIGVRLWSGTVDILPSTSWWERITNMCPTSLNCRYVWALTYWHTPPDPFWVYSTKMCQNAQKVYLQVLIEKFETTCIHLYKYLLAYRYSVYGGIHTPPGTVLKWVGVNLTTEARTNRNKRSQAFHPPTSIVWSRPSHSSHSHLLIFPFLHPGWWQESYDNYRP